MTENKLRIGVKRGEGPSPGYKYAVLIFDVAYREAREVLTEEQYSHAAGLVRDLAQHEDPTHSVTQRVEPIESYHELKDKGGILAKINLRVFFYVDKVRSSLVILGAINKKNDGPTPRAVRLRMTRRLRQYQELNWTEE